MMASKETHQLVNAVSRNVRRLSRSKQLTIIVIRRVNLNPTVAPYGNAKVAPDSMSGVYIVEIVRVHFTNTIQVNEPRSQTFTSMIYTHHIHDVGLYITSKHINNYGNKLLSRCSQRSSTIVTESDKNYFTNERNTCKSMVSFYASSPKWTSKLQRSF